MFYEARDRTCGLKVAARMRGRTERAFRRLCLVTLAAGVCIGLLVYSGWFAGAGGVLRSTVQIATVGLIILVVITFRECAGRIAAARLMADAIASFCHNNGPADMMEVVRHLGVQDPDLLMDVVDRLSSAHSIRPAPEP